MINEYKTIKFKLNGKQSVSIPIDIKQNGRYVTDPLDVRVRGFVKFDQKESQGQSAKSSNDLIDKTVVYPVLFSSHTVRVENGRCLITLLPRSEDLFEETESLIESASINDENIINKGGISADEQITDPSKSPVVIKIEAGKIREPYKLSIEVTVTGVGNNNFYVKTIDRGTSPTVEKTSASTFLFKKEKIRIPSNIIVNCYNDEEWVPSVTNILGDNSSTKEVILDKIEDVKNSTPFGMSPMYDAVVSAARILSSELVHDERKTIYVFTDNESNISEASVENALEEVNDIGGYRQVPVLIGNMSVVEPSTLSVKANASDTKNINKLSFLTGGQALTIVDESYLEDITGIFFREAVGSMGYGTYEFIADLGEQTIINKITAFFDVPSEGSNATWSIEVSLDGYNFTQVDDSYSYTEEAEFQNLYARYIRFKIILITAINSIESGSGVFPESPSLLSICILYNSYKVSYLYLNKVDVDIPLYQITLAVDANNVNDEQISVGVANSDSSTWEDFSTKSQPSVEGNGKVVIPLRFSQDTTQFQQEPLKKIDKFMLKTEYGDFDTFANVVLYDKEDTVINTNKYKLRPREGIIVFNYALPSDYADGDYKIGIINSDKYKIGIKMTNKTNSTAIELYGVGYLYTTGKDLMPPLAKSSPEVESALINGDVFDRFSIMTATYSYYDRNLEPEDVSRRRLKWFINGSPIIYLDNVMSWNDLNNPSDPIYLNTSLTYPVNLEEGESIQDWAKKQDVSILHTGDKVHFEIQVSDGSLYSDNIKSNVIDIFTSTPVLGQLTVLAEFDGKTTDRLSPRAKAIIYPPISSAFYSDGGVNTSEIIWYVNGEIFKRGIYGASVPNGVAPYHEIWSGETGSEVYKGYGLRRDNSIYAQVIPKNGDKVGNVMTTSPVRYVQNSIPEIYDHAYVGSVHYKTDNIVLGWKFFDFEIQFLGDIDETNQFDRTIVKWYSKNYGDTIWPETPVYIYNDPDNSFKETFNVDSYRGNISTNIGSHTSTVSSNIIHVGQQWYVEIIPDDTIDTGEKKTLTIITIVSK